MFGVSIRLTMTDTDSAAYQVRFPVFLTTTHTDQETAVQLALHKGDSAGESWGRQNSRSTWKCFCRVLQKCPRIIDRAHFAKDKVYFDPSRKKKVGLYTDEVPLPNMVVSFQACGPKNYQYKKIEVDRGKCNRGEQGQT